MAQGQRVGEDAAPGPTLAPGCSGGANAPPHTHVCAHTRPIFLQERAGEKGCAHPKRLPRPGGDLHPLAPNASAILEPNPKESDLPRAGISDVRTRQCLQLPGYYLDKYSYQGVMRPLPSTGSTTQQAY